MIFNLILKKYQLFSNEILKRQRDLLLSENTQLKNELEQGSLFEEKQGSTQKEAKLLKQMIRTIEEKNLKEKNVFVKKLQQKTKEIEHLKAQLDALRVSERHLQGEVRSLNSQLRMNRNRFKSICF